MDNFLVGGLDIEDFILSGPEHFNFIHENHSVVQYISTKYYFYLNFNVS